VQASSKTSWTEHEHNQETHQDSRRVSTACLTAAEQGDRGWQAHAAAAAAGDARRAELLLLLLLLLLFLLLMVKRRKRKQDEASAAAEPSQGHPPPWGLASPLLRRQTGGAAALQSRWLRCLQSTAALLPPLHRPAAPRVA